MLMKYTDVETSLYLFLSASLENVLEMPYYKYYMLGQFDSMTSEKFMYDGYSLDFLKQFGLLASFQQERGPFFVP